MTLHNPRAALDRAYDALIAERTGDAVAVTEARRQFDARRGVMHEDESLWEAWSSAFVDAFCLETPHATSRAVTEPALRQALATSHRSAFVIETIAAGQVTIADALGGARFAVTEPRALHGVAVGDTAELRVMAWAGEVWFGRTFIYHPPAAAQLASHLWRQGQTRDAILDELAMRCWKSLRYRHVPPARLYAP